MKNGFLYEDIVLQAIKSAGASGRITTGARSSSVGHDADFTYKGKVYNLEVKLNRNAQMGGSSIKYNQDTQEVTLLKETESGIKKILIEAVQQKRPELDRMLNFVAEKWNKNIKQFPFTCSKEVWSMAQKEKLLINTKVSHTVSYIAEHYAKKNVHYIQIGGSGMFFLKDNPASLPVPKLDGDIKIEIRSGRSGSKKYKGGPPTVGAGIRIQARLITKNLSPYTFDSPTSIGEVLGWQNPIRYFG